MSAEEMKALERCLIEEVWNGGNLDVAEECFTPDYVNHDPSIPEEIRGLEGFKQNVTAIRSAFPDFRMRIVDQVAEAEKLVTRYVITGIQVIVPLRKATGMTHIERSAEQPWSSSRVRWHQGTYSPECT